LDNALICAQVDHLQVDLYVYHVYLSVKLVQMDYNALLVHKIFIFMMVNALQIAPTIHIKIHKQMNAIFVMFLVMAVTDLILIIA
jgi:hypothetical protein